MIHADAENSGGDSLVVEKVGIAAASGAAKV
jgi:hypothetical protein